MSKSKLTEATPKPATPNGKQPKGRHGPPAALFWFLSGLTILVVSLVLFAGLPRLTVGILSIVILLLLLLLGMPIGYAMIAASTLGLIKTNGIGPALSTLGATTYDSVATWYLNVVPLFVLMGVAMWKSGVTAKAYTAARQWFGWMPGGLAIATNYAGAGLATTSGSTMGITFALTRMALPEMLASGYRASLSTGSVAMAGTLGQIIPPSILLIIYAGVAEVPVGPQLMAGIVPGVMLALGFGAVILVWAILRPQDAPKQDILDITWRTRFASLQGVTPIGLVALVVIGGMFFGIFTASEAAAFGAVTALATGWLSAGRGNRGLRQTWDFLRSTFTESVRSIAGLFVIIVGAYLFTKLLALSLLAQGITRFLIQLDLDRVQFLMVLILVYLVLGMFLESLPMILLTVPLLQGPLEALDIDMLWFGVFVIIMCEIGMVFPPIGILTFIVHRLAKNPEVNVGHRVTLIDVFKGTMPFVAFAIALLVVFIFWPDIVLWLPTMNEP